MYVVHQGMHVVHQGIVRMHVMHQSHVLHQSMCTVRNLGTASLSVWYQTLPVCLPTTAFARHERV